MTSSDTEFINILDVSSGSGKPVRAPGKKAPGQPEVLPILGLADFVMFPGIVAPLIVDTKNSIRLIDDVVGGDRHVGLVLQHDPEKDDPDPEHLFTFGCFARVLKMLKFPDNTVRVLVEGLGRFEVEAFTEREPYLRAQVKHYPEIVRQSIELTALARNARLLFEQAIDLSPALNEQVKVAALNTEEPARLADLIAANLNLDLQERQKLLETSDVRKRLNRLLPMLNRELEVLTLGSKIQQQVANSMSKSQRDIFLREQMRVIQKELGEADPGAEEVEALREQVEKADLPEEAEKVALKELERLQQSPPAVAEHTIIRNYLDWIISLPWRKSTEDEIDLDEAARILNAHHFGLNKVKDRLLEYLAVIKLRREMKGPILCLVGPPGVGKTSLGKSVAEALGRKFVRISLGGVRDEAEIRGHRRTYVGAMPGRIIQNLHRCETNNPLMLLDEIDKVSSDFRGDPSAALLEVLDPQQNHTFTDHYLDLAFDLSRVLFITTANWLDPIHPALRDRMEVIELPSYTTSEKFEIARRHLVPRQIEEHGLTKKQVRFHKAALVRLIQEYTREAGLRQLEREIASLVRKAARKILSDPKRSSAITIGGDDLHGLLGAPRFVSETAEAITECGIATGLAWTPVGGEILFIEATRMPGKGNLLLTGSLGDVMKESAQTALSFLRSQSNKLDLELKDFDQFDIHVHVPSGATPKDGPSAGVTILVALASVLTGRRVKSDVAMTGETSLRGRVLPVGGVKEKVLAALRSGIRRVVLPDQNRNDWAEVPEDVRKKMKVHFVRHVSELLPLTLRK